MFSGLTNQVSSMTSGLFSKNSEEVPTPAAGEEQPSQIAPASTVDPSAGDNNNAETGR